MSHSPNSTLLGEISTGAKSAIRVSIDDLGGKRFVNIRTWYVDPAGAWRPTRKGVVVSIRDLSTLADALRHAIEMEGWV